MPVDVRLDCPHSLLQLLLLHAALARTHPLGQHPAHDRDLLHQRADLEVAHTALAGRGILHGVVQRLVELAQTVDHVADGVSDVEGAGEVGAQQLRGGGQRAEASLRKPAERLRRRLGRAKIAGAAARRELPVLELQEDRSGLLLQGLEQSLHRLRVQTGRRLRQMAAQFRRALLQLRQRLEPRLGT